MARAHRALARDRRAALVVSVALGVAVVGTGVPAGAGLSSAWANSATAPLTASSPAGARQALSSGRRRVSRLRGAVAADDEHVTQLSAGISTLTTRVAGLQRSLDAKRAQLLAARVQATSAQVKLTHLERESAGADDALAAELVGSYEGDQPDIITAVVQATGFNDLLDRLDFVGRVSRQDARVVGRAAAARAAVAAQAGRLGRLSAHRNEIAEQFLAQRNREAVQRVELVSQRLAAARARATNAEALAGAQSAVVSLSAQLARLEASQQATDRTASPSRPSGSTGHASAPTGHGIPFPMPVADVSPPATWSLDNGVDIAAPGGTPELAVCSGTIVLHGIGGFGPSAPVLRCDAPLAGYDDVYYGHAGPGHWTPIGTHLARGQIISEVGSGIVGISSGPHLEIGFADSGGSPVGASSAPAMMSLLRAAYSG
ncbi:MAG: hypothetical protein WAL63_11445 [Solirubrobacteraceae bacterium]